MIKKCPFCKDGFLERQTISETYTYKGYSIEVEQPGEFCNSCDEGILNGTDMKATDKQIRDFQSQIDGLLTSNEIKAIRKKLKLTKKQAAKLVGSTSFLFSRYELGEVTPVRSISHLLRLLNNRPERLQELSN